MEGEAMEQEGSKGREGEDGWMAGGRDVECKRTAGLSGSGKAGGCSSEERGGMSGEEIDGWEKGMKGKEEMSSLGVKETNGRWKKWKIAQGCKNITL